jgi:hypothetical protein
VSVFHAGHGCYRARHHQQADGVYDPQRTMSPGKGPSRHLQQHQQPNQRHHIGERDENLAQRDRRQPAKQQLARQQPQGHQHNARREPRKAPRPVPPQQNHQQHEQRRKRQRPENLKGRKTKIEVHFCLVRAAR